jgi:hypothetical protein
MPRKSYTIWDALERLGIKDVRCCDDPFGDPQIRERMGATIVRSVTRTTASDASGTTARVEGAQENSEGPAPTSPFLLPLCVTCGGVTRLARVHVQSDQEQRFYICDRCGVEHAAAPLKRQQQKN